MKGFLALIFFLTSSVTLFAQQRIEVMDSGSKSGGGDYISKEIDGEVRGSALVVIQSTAKLNYSVMGVTITDKEMKRSLDNDGIYTDTLYFYVNDFDSRRKLVLFAQGFPSEAIDLNMKSNTTYSYMVATPNNMSSAEVLEETAENYESLLSKGKAAIVSTQFEYAEKLLARASQIKETDEVFANLALSQYGQARPNAYGEAFFDKAIKSAKKSLALNSNNYLANLVAGLSYYQKAYSSSGGKSFNIDTHVKSAIGSLKTDAIIRSKTNNSATGGSYQKVLSLGGDIDLYIKTVEYLYKAIDLNPDEFPEYELTGDAYNRLFIFTLLRELPSVGINTPRYNYYYSLSSSNNPIIRYSSQKKSPNLNKYANNQTAFYLRAAKREPSPELYYKIGEGYILLDMFDKAIESFEKSITPDNNKGQYRIADIKRRSLK